MTARRPRTAPRLRWRRATLDARLADLADHGARLATLPAATAEDLAALRTAHASWCHAVATTLRRAIAGAPDAEAYTSAPPQADAAALVAGLARQRGALDTFRARLGEIPETAGRRGHHEGSIYQRASDGRWAATVDLGHRPDGRRWRTTLYGRTRREVADKLDELRQKQALGLPPAPRSELLGTFLDRWLASLRPRPQGHYSPTTLKGYSDVVRVHLKPHLGHVRVSDLSADHVENLQERLLAAGYASQTVLNVRNALRVAVREAMRKRLLAYNPIELVKAPPASIGRGQAMEEHETPRFLAAIRGHRLEVAFLMELALGCRRSELLALEWADVDLRPGREQVRIRQGLHRVRGEGLLVLRPKSASGDRTLAIPLRLAEQLRTHRDRQDWERIRAAERWGNTLPDGTERLVFTTSKGTPVEPAHFSRDVKAVLRAAGLGHLRGHDLRHSASSILQAGGLPPLAAMKVLGHSRPDVTLGTYGHLLDASRRQAAALMDDYLEAAEGRKPASRPGRADSQT